MRPVDSTSLVSGIMNIILINPILCFHPYSETVDYQTVYSGGNGQVLVLGVVPHSHITIVVYSMEDGEIIKQVFPNVFKFTSSKETIE